MGRGLAIRYFMGKFALCDGKPPKNITPEPNEIYIGTIINMYDTWEEADSIRELIANLYR
jgi:hypothetical protein